MSSMATKEYGKTQRVITPLAFSYFVMIVLLQRPFCFSPFLNITSMNSELIHG